MDVDAEQDAVKEFYAARDARLQERKLGDIRAILKTPEGRRVWWDVMDSAGPFRASFVKDSPHMTSFNEGQRDVGQKMFADLMEAAPERFAQMQREYASEKKQQADEEARRLEEIKEAH